MRYEFHCDLNKEQVDEVLALSLYGVVHTMGHNEGGYWILLEAR